MNSSQNVVACIVLIISIITLAIRKLWQKLIDHSLAAETIVNEAKQMHVCPTSKKDETVVVIGAGIGGCLTAAMLVRHFTKVILVDPVDIDRDPRSHIAQIDQAHNLGSVTLHCCESLWPKGVFVQKLQEFGGRLVNNSKSRFEFHTKAGNISWSDRVRGLNGEAFYQICATRRQLHHVLRHLVQLQTPNVEFMLGKVEQIQCKGKIIESVEVVQESSKKNIPCSFLVDCSGTSNVYRHLISDLHDFNKPKIDEYCMHVQYSTGVMHLHPDVAKKWPKMQTHADDYNPVGTISVFVPTLSSDTNFWLLNRYENDMITLANMSYESKPLSKMPTTIDEMQRGWNASHFGLYGKEKEEWFDQLMDLLRESEELTGEKLKCVRYRDHRSYCLESTHSLLPRNMILIGDVFCKLNPAFGQGCQKASSEVMLLHSLLLQYETSSCIDEKSQAVQDLQSIFDKILPQFCEKQEVLAKRLFILNRALDMSQPEVVKANPHLSPRTGSDVRFLSKGMWNWIAKRQDVKMGDLFMSVNFIGTGAPAQLLHPFNLFRILYAALFL